MMIESGSRYRRKVKDPSPQLSLDELSNDGLGCVGTDETDATGEKRGAFTVVQLSPSPPVKESRAAAVDSVTPCISK